MVAGCIAICKAIHIILLCELFFQTILLVLMELETLPDSLKTPSISQKFGFPEMKFSQRGLRPLEKPSEINATLRSLL